ncbi:MAG TPA: hypothetical protein VLI54_00265 [Bacillota bacterium]|nr:hypothetical protein [Bacillota bacterium]
MKKLHILATSLIVTVLAVGFVAWNRAYANNDNSKSIVGAWFVKAPDAPFQYHMFVFNADGTMQQANPDAGDANTSDSDGKGVWVKSGNNKIKGKFVEVTADRTTHAFVSRGEISFELNVDNTTFDGNAAARFYDESNHLIRGPLPTSLHGSRVTLP